MLGDVSAVVEQGHVLVIEDDRAIQEALRDFLETEGYKVETACDGGEALRILQSTTDLPSLILLDLMMPGVDGFEFRQRQLSDLRLAGIPVVAMSADGKALERLAATHTVKCLRKPIDVEDLLVSVETYF